MNFLNLNDLYSPHIQKDKNKLNLYDNVYSKCILKIKKTNNELRQMECFYRVPPYNFGGPIYNYDELKQYLLFKLLDNGLFAEYIDVETLYISWKPQDINKTKYLEKLNRMRNHVDRKYNISSEKVHEKEIKHHKKGRDNVTGDTSNIGILQYSDRIQDMVPINPKKLNKYKPLDTFPLQDKIDYFEVMNQNKI